MMNMLEIQMEICIEMCAYFMDSNAILLADDTPNVLTIMW